MKKNLKTGFSKIIASTLAFVMIVLVSITGFAFAAGTDTSDGTVMYRLYCSSTGEHLYTGDAYERDTLISSDSWVYEGIGWVAPKTGNPVYRLYNNISHEHLYTKDEHEKQALEVKSDWVFEGIAWYTQEDGECNTPVYRLYHPLLPEINSHHYTLDENERDVLVQDFGWQFEGTAWFATHDTQLEYKADATCSQRGYSGDLICKNCAKCIVEGTVTETTNNHEHLTYHPAEGGETITYNTSTVTENCGICGAPISGRSGVDEQGNLIAHFNSAHGYNFAQDEWGDIVQGSEEEFLQLCDACTNHQYHESYGTYQIGGTKEWWECLDCGKRSFDKVNWS